jgi:aspartyl-tRNA(Asn)/glutamyl-tRNA(Gln) amidotransferase subunit C
MALTKDEVKKVAKLANLPLSEEEEEKYADQLSKILEYVEQLNKVDTSDVEPTFNVSGQSNITAEDEVSTCLPQDMALKNASKKTEQFFTTKGVFNNE